MEQQKSEPPTDILHLNSADLPERERMEVVRDAWARTLMRFDLEPQAGWTDIAFDARMRAIGTVGCTVSQTTPVATHRTKAQLEDGNDGIYLAFSRESYLVRDDKGRDFEVPSGGGSLLSLARSHQIHTFVACESGTIHVSRRHLQTLVPNLDDAPIALIAPRTPGFMLLRRYAKLITLDPLEAPELRAAADEHIHQLFAIVAGATGDALRYAIENGGAAARLRVIKADIAGQMENPEFRLETIALQHGLSPRHIQRLFEAEGTSFSHFLNSVRLSKAHRLLQNPQVMHLKIIAIAYECGYGDISTFNRAFRRTYGMTPGDVRRAAALGDFPD